MVSLRIKSETTKNINNMISCLNRNIHIKGLKLAMAK